jgi:hypothetical protein
MDRARTGRAGEGADPAAGPIDGRPGLNRVGRNMDAGRPRTMIGRTGARSATVRSSGAGGLRAGGLLILTGLLLLVGGCEKDTGAMPTNLPPVTYLSVIGTDLDTLDYRQVLHWWGSDRDGQIVGYLIKWDSGWTPPDTARRWAEDPAWIVTEATTDTFALATFGLADSTCADPTLPCPPKYAHHTFHVRALDNRGMADPVGQTQEFSVENSPPVLEWSHSFARPIRSLPAVAFAWHPIDLDGAGTVRSFVYWLTRPGAAPTDSFYTADTLIALPPTAFGPPGDPQPGIWTLHVLASDNAHARSLPIDHTWDVQLPDGNYLLIDNVAEVVPGAATEDDFFRAMIDSVTGGDYHVMDIEHDGGFRTGVEVGPFLELFKGVLWYAGMQNRFNDPVVARNLALAEQDGGLRDYLAGGGRFFLCAQNAVGDSAAFTRSFQLENFGIADWYRMRDLTSDDPDYVNGNIPLPSRSVVRALVDGQTDSLLTVSAMIAADFLLVAPDITPLITVDPGLLARVYPDSTGFRFTPDDQKSTPAVIGLLSERHGRAAVMSLILSRANGFQNRDRITQSLLRRVLID